MWIEFLADKGVRWSPRVTQSFSEGAIENLPHEKANELVEEGVARRTRKPRKSADDDAGAESVVEDDAGLTDEDTDAG